MMCELSFVRMGRSLCALHYHHHLPYLRHFSVYSPLFMTTPFFLSLFIQMLVGQTPVIASLAMLSSLLFHSSIVIPPHSFSFLFFAFACRPSLLLVSFIFPFF
uniref:Uncharacterized protein n=1 Tax=Trypanosoma vivax (strain Y486) TaxID=1055687 RepID=G0U3M4_TRYVY|nr:hypothetical protein TVY486_0907020 [Trypanosoma vivax Y486]